MATNEVHVKEFITALTRLDRVALIRLNRDSGKRVQECTCPDVFYRILPDGVDAWDIPMFFLVATQFANIPNGQTSFPAAFRSIRNKTNANGLDRRMARLLDSDRDELLFRLPQCISLMKQYSIRLNWEQLLTDLLNWQRGYVKSYWGRTYYSKSKNTSIKIVL